MFVIVAKNKVVAVEAPHLHVEKIGEITIHLMVVGPIHLPNEDGNRKRYHAREIALVAAIQKTTVAESKQRTEELIEKTATELIVMIDDMKQEVGVVREVAVESEEIKDLKREEKRRRKGTKRKG